MSKGPGVEKMFDAIADRYDLMNRVMTFGQDRRWKDFVVDSMTFRITVFVLPTSCIDCCSMGVH